MNDTIMQSQPDTVFIERIVLDPATANYIEILEKTNSQLSLWYNPYGFFVAALGLLFTVVTVVAIWITYRQSQDFKSRLEETTKGYQKLIEAFISSKDAALEALIKDFKDRSGSEISSLKQQIQTSHNPQEVESLKKKVEELERRREVAENPSRIVAVDLQRMMEAAARTHVDASRYWKFFNQKKSGPPLDPPSAEDKPPM